MFILSVSHLEIIKALDIKDLNVATISQSSELQKNSTRLPVQNQKRTHAGPKIKICHHPQQILIKSR